MAAWKRIHREILSGAAAAGGEDCLAVEEALELRIHGQAVATLLCTPGREGDLVAGFLASERVIASGRDLAGIEPCAAEEGEEGDAPRIWNAVLAPGVPFDPRARRFGAVNSACGLCGAARIRDLREDAVPPPAGAAPPAVDWLLGGFESMRRSQALFDRTAGVHAAALQPLGAREAEDVAEDVGRHNAVDKVLGARLRAGRYPLQEPCALLVSGRVSFEILQKAALAGVAVLAGAGAPTSLAAEGAGALGIMLYGRVRGDGGNRYAGGATGES